MRQSCKWVFHPILFSIYPVLFLFSENVSEVYVRDIILPLLFLIIFSILLWKATYVVLRNKHKAALITSLTLLMLFVFRHTYELLMSFVGLDLSRKYFLIPWFILYAGCIFLFKLVKNEMLFYTRFFNYLSIILLILACGNIVLFYLKPRISPSSNLNGLDISWIQNRQNSHIRKSPDIYYLIFDGYGGAESLKKYYDFDNEIFLELLKLKRFVIINNATSNYSFTHESMASSLNMNYIHDDNFQPDRESVGRNNHAQQGRTNISILRV